MSRLYDTVEPSVVSEEMLRTAVEEQGPKEEASKIARDEGIDFADVTELRLDYKNILKIDNLWSFQSLVKLQLDNNIIEKIEGLDILVNLVWLDLSFNNIEVIEGLEKLTQLQDLTLFNNRIQRLANMDTLAELHVFSIGNNDLKDLDNVTYLRRFKKLQTINLSGNPICQLEEYKMYIIAYLPTIEYLDYRLVDETVKAAAYEKYEISIQEKQHEEKLDETKQTELTAKEREFLLHKSAYIENLDGPQLFETMYLDDVEGKKLNEMPGIDEILPAFRERFIATCRQMFEAGLQGYDARNQEVDGFLASIEEAKLENKKLASAKIDEFMEYKNKLWQDLAHTTEQVAVELMVAEYHQNVGDLWDALMGLEMQLVDQLEDAIRDYERNMTDLVGNFLETIQGKFTELRNYQREFKEALLELATVTLDKVVKNELDDEISDDLREIFIDKDSVTNAVTASNDVHSLKIDNREDEIITRIRQWLSSLIEDTHDREEVTRNRARVIEINNLIDHLRDEIENVDMSP